MLPFNIAALPTYKLPDTVPVADANTPLVVTFAAVTLANVDTPVTPNVPLAVTFVALNVVRVVAPVTPNVPPIVSLPVTLALASVVAPAVNPANVVAPVTPNVPPTVALFVTAKLFGELCPVVLNVVKAPVPGVTLPIAEACKPPPTVKLPVSVSFATVSVPNVVAPVTPNVPLNVPFVAFTLANVDTPVTANVLDNVVAPVTANVELRVAAPVTLNVEFNEAVVPTRPLLIFQVSVALVYNNVALAPSTVKPAPFAAAAVAAPLATVTFKSVTSSVCDWIAVN